MFSSLFTRRAPVFHSGDLFIRARPREIRINEIYSYAIHLSGLSNVREQGTPQGKIELIVPYDGHNYVTEAARRDVSEVVDQLRRFQGEPTDARMGHLVFTNHERTDLDALVELPNNALPLDLPIYGFALRQLADLAGRGGEAHFTQQYSPQHLAVPPLEIRATVTDNGRERELQAGQDGSWYGGTTTFGGALICQFYLELSLPAPVKGHPRLKRMTINWPPTASYHRAHLSADGEPALMWIEPEAGNLAWGGIDFEPVETDEETKGAPGQRFRLPVLALHVEEPGELLKRLPLKGELEIELKYPLSGLQLHLFDATGTLQMMPPVQMETILKAAIEFDVAGSFAYRSASPFLQLIFPGAVFDEHRLGDIHRLLDAEGFVEIKETAISPSDNRIGHLITARRMESSGELLLSMRVEGTTLETMHEHLLHGGHSYTTPRPSGDTTITIRAALVGDRWRPVQVLNRLHRLLKERFDHAHPVS